MDVISSNSGNTLDKTINYTFEFYASYQNETLFVNFGDNQEQKIDLITKSKIIIDITFYKRNFSILI